MNKDLQAILNFVQQSERLNDDEKESILKSLKDANKEIEITAFKLDRTEKVKRTTAILLEETIEELEQKRKAVEAQNKELEIESSLERVRTVAMAMQRPRNLLDICEILFIELGKLGFHELRNAMINIHHDDGNFLLNYDFTAATGKTVTNVPYNFHPVVNKQMEVTQNVPDAFYEFSLLGEELKEFRELRKKNGEQDDLKLEVTEALYYYFYSIGTGSIGISTYSSIAGEKLDLLKRFRNVFNLSYQRYTDISLAEAQAREAQIELALERVRARTMAMQYSDELAETASILFQQIKSLGFETWSCGFCIWKNDTIAEAWMGADSGGLLPPLMIPYKREQTHHEIYKAHLQEMKSYDYVWEGEDLENHYAFLKTIPSVKDAIDMMEKSGLVLPRRQCYYVGFFKKGYLLLITKERNDELKDLSQRLALVFDLTYTRFLDLQKAEAQAREAQIEVALERVRSRSMGMQKSEELSEVIQIVYNQFVHLNIPAEHTGFVMDYKTRGDYKLWIADRFGSPSQVTIPYFDSIYYNEFNKAKENGIDFFITTLSFKEKNKFYEELFKHVPGLPEESQEIIFNAAGYSISTALLENVSLYIENFTGIPFSDEENAILMRFGKVFQQTYTRFLDLQKAEAQAMEAIKRASVDRVRAEIASMRTTKDLQRIQPLIWNELTSLSISFTRCGVFIMDDDAQIVHTFLSSPEGKAIATLHIPFNFDFPLTTNGISHWRRKEVYKEYWDAAAFISSWALLSTLSEATGNSHQQDQAPENLYLHLLPFVQGMLYVGNNTPLNEMQLQLVQNLADAFATAYARYEDFNKLEGAKKQVDSALNELQAAQKQLIQSEKMASLGELTAGIAHEIQNPLNFVNNFSDVNKELLAELNEEIEKGNYEDVKIIAADIAGNEEKINHHGKRADSIVKGMLQHSRSTGNVKELTNINVLADEYFRLAYHGLRAKDKSFNAALKTDYDQNIGRINIIPQEISRVILNVITNAFYTVNEKKKQHGSGYEPTVSVITKKTGDTVELKITDNGNGIPQKIVDKIFQPFFTTKPTGQGTGLGLSLAYDIVKAHGGKLSVETHEGVGSTFIIELPVNNA